MKEVWKPHLSFHDNILWTLAWKFLKYITLHFRSCIKQLIQCFI